jgi:hypothetical protein
MPWSGNQPSRELTSRYCWHINDLANRTNEQIAEEDFELRAAFGEGETVLNVITGKRRTI